MMDLGYSLPGRVAIKLVSADVLGLLNQIANRNITLYNTTYLDDITLTAIVSRMDYKNIADITKKRGGKVIILNRIGSYWALKSLLGRPVLLAGIILLLILALYLPSRILFVQVRGNSAVSSKKILEISEQCGISMFSSRRAVRSEKVKNAVLDKIPQLQWIGVNTDGCVATISVSEKAAQNESKPVDGVCSIVASRDGVVTDMTVTSGNPLCKSGDVVKSGQVLISGYTDCAIKIQASRADGEVFARTYRKLSVKTPQISHERVKISVAKRKFSLKFGKKLIKLYNGSGISDASCVRIDNEIELTLPGGFSLPVSLIMETTTDFECTEKVKEDCFWIEQAAEDYLLSQMVAGKIISQEACVNKKDGVVLWVGNYSCHEMIGKVKDESIIQR